MNTESPVIYWFRQDLRLTDLPAWNAAVATGQPLVACYVMDRATPGDFAPGAASQWWLHHSLEALSAGLSALGVQLVLLQGDTLQEINKLVDACGAQSVYCSRCYEPWAQALEAQLHSELASQHVELKRYAGSLLHEPERIRTGTGTPFRVFSPFWKKCLLQPVPDPSGPAGTPQQSASTSLPGLPLEALQLLPQNPNWAAGWESIWRPGAEGAQTALADFVDSGLSGYREGRDYPNKQQTSRLSPHLHFGEISPRQVWHAIQQHAPDDPELDSEKDKFLAELGWREFNQHLLTNFPTTVNEPFNDKFRRFPCLGNKQHLAAWQQGMTGYPLVDAGMRELWQTGFMHNRVRMVCASFLTKHLLLPWQEGARWFWDTLVDADAGNNTGGWQWAAGCGADAAPYFRIFNPTLQSRKFDAAGCYVRRWVPELANLPDRHLHEPAAAPEAILKEAGVVLGKTYPSPIVEHKTARESALAAYATL